ncbi:MAG: metallophosphoesterase [Eubacteriaceae bacterium]|nr:metallophosphoesterase [Eubacteriaceae bacterium]
MKNKRIETIFYAYAVTVFISLIGVSIFIVKYHMPQTIYANSMAKISEAYPQAKFAVISDLHFYSESLGVSGTAFENVLQADRKMLRESKELISFALERIIESSVDFVLISGDLTKDGELVNHLALAEMLKRLTDAGIKAYVTPGNHDINNFNAEKYDGDSKERVETVSPEAFREIYHDYGYGSAVKADPNSLSYISEPLPGLWVLSIDSCQYELNSPDLKESVVSGKISQSQANWLSEALSDAISQEKAVIAFMHHGVNEHWKGQSKLHPDYLVDDYTYVSEFLSSYGVQLVFTGHYHAQSIAKSENESGILYDIETGSLVTYPCPIRYCGIDGYTIEIESERIGDTIHPATSFAENARGFIKKTISKEASDTILGYRVSDGEAEYIAECVADAFVAHYSGNADPSQRVDLNASKLGIWGKIVYAAQKYVVDGLWEQQSLDDNNTTLELLPQKREIVKAN